jgi:hypothetical protein
MKCAEDWALRLLVAADTIEQAEERHPALRRCDAFRRHRRVKLGAVARITRAGKATMRKAL